MVLENPLAPLGEWLPGAVAQWAIVIGVLAAVVLLVSFGAALLRAGGVGAGADRWADGALLSLRDITSTSPRRVFALAILAARETLRNRILVALAVFCLGLMFIGWLAGSNAEQSKRFLDNIFFWMPLLVILVTLLLAAFSLPNDLRRRTIYTIVTKPVRASEIVLGRILGFTFVGTVLFAAMALFGYIFVVRMVEHRHAILPDEIVELDLPAAGAKFNEETIVERGRLDVAGEHRHTYTMNAAGWGRTDDNAGHWHAIRKDVTPRLHAVLTDPADATRVDLRFTEPLDPASAANLENYSLSNNLAVRSATLSENGRRVLLTASGPVAAGQQAVSVSPNLMSRIGRALATTSPVTLADEAPPRDPSAYTVYGPEDLFRARVPVYGHLTFTYRDGTPRSVGISVGSEWTYRSYIEGQTQAAAIWNFDNVSAARFGEVLPVEFIINVFRTHKGRIDKTVRCTVVLRHPEQPEKATLPRQFFIKDSVPDPHLFPRRQAGMNEQGARVEYDIYDDLVHDGKLQVVLQCQDSGQFVGVAQPDAYLVAREGNFTLNYVKATVAAWFPIPIVASLGVLMSTFLSGHIAMAATMLFVIVGFFWDFVHKIAIGAVHGGGPVEAWYRLVTQRGALAKLDDDFKTSLMRTLDSGIRVLLDSAIHVIPNLRVYYHNDYLAGGFDIPGQNLAILTLKMLAYVVPAVLLACLILRGREVAR